MQRIAPNNNLPAKSTIIVWCDGSQTFHNYIPNTHWSWDWTVVAIFRIRENKLQTKHKF